VGIERAGFFLFGKGRSGVRWWKGPGGGKRRSCKVGSGEEKFVFNGGKLEGKRVLVANFQNRTVRRLRAGKEVEVEGMSDFNFREPAERRAVAHPTKGRRKIRFRGKNDHEIAAREDGSGCSSKKTARGTTSVRRTP